MMIVLGITVALIILLITTLVILRRRKKCASCSPKETLISESKAPEPTNLQEKKPVANAEPAAANSPITTANVVAEQVKETAVAPAENISALPQDSILRRHYFTHLCTMLEAIAPPRPTESVLCRHYDMMIVTKIAQCLGDINATEQLICDYENLSV